MMSSVLTRAQFSFHMSLFSVDKNKHNFLFHELRQIAFVNYCDLNEDQTTQGEYLQQK